MADVDVARVLAHYAGLEGATARRFGGGLINDTFQLELADQRWILQRINPIFSARIHENIDAVTRHLAARGFTTSRLVATSEGQLCLSLPTGEVWRLMTFIEGATFDAVQSTAQVRGAGMLVGRFHAALDDLEYTFHDMRVGVHDTQAHLSTLQAAVKAHVEHALHAQVQALASKILEAATQLEPLPLLADRTCHGDLKFNNVRFAGVELPGKERPVCLIDLDTVGPMHLGYEMGDALRSWCNRAGENQTGSGFDLQVCEAAIEGYVEGVSRSLSEAERRSILLGVEWVSLELSARFAADALLEVYFGWDPTSYTTRGEHNLVRAQGQWALFEAARKTHDSRAQLLRLR
jgi:Ser/Thr protein kinase RdoA (MazF antagonist)